MSRLPLSLGCGAYDIVRPLLDGDVTVEGVSLTAVTVMPPAELFWRQLRHEEFDVAEISLLNYLMEVGRDDDRFVAIPVFPYRAFRHSAIWVREESPIERPADLKGKRIGVPEYAMTMLLFVRGFLESDHGVSPSDVEWITVRPERLEYQSASVEPRLAAPGSTLEGLLLSDQVDAIVTTRVFDAEARARMGIRRMLRDARAVEMQYYRQTRIFPIMHTIVLRRAIYEANRWVAASLFAAFQAAKAEAYAALRDGHPEHLLPWFNWHVEDEWDVFGGDPYPYGLDGNTPTLEAALDWCLRQDMIPRPVRLDEVFAVEATDSFTYAGQR